MGSVADGHHVVEHEVGVACVVGVGDEEEACGMSGMLVCHISSHLFIIISISHFIYYHIHILFYFIYYYINILNILFIIIFIFYFICYFDSA